MVPLVRKTAFAVLALVMLPASGSAENTSVYSTIDFDKTCQWKTPESEEEAQMGGEAVCTGLENYPVNFLESDLRQYVTYGQVRNPVEFPTGFSEWNYANKTIEWRLEDGRPFAAIHRWFIDNINPDTGASDGSRQGQVLVISTVATPSRPSSCPAGYVDALANPDANVLARIVADDYANGFRCGVDSPAFHGRRGPLSGHPQGAVQQ